MSRLPIFLPELELRSLERTRRLLTLQKWLFGFALFFCCFWSKHRIFYPQRTLPGIPLLGPRLSRGFRRRLGAFAGLLAILLLYPASHSHRWTLNELNADKCFPECR